MSAVSRLATIPEAMKKILIATDGSDAARAAVDVGLELAADEDADVVLAHGLPRTSTPTSSSSDRAVSDVSSELCSAAPPESS